MEDIEIKDEDIEGLRDFLEDYEVGPEFKLTKEVYTIENLYGNSAYSGIRINGIAKKYHVAISIISGGQFGKVPEPICHVVIRGQEGMCEKAMEEILKEPWVVNDYKKKPESWEINPW